MELKGNRGEWSELYTLLKLLADGNIYAADENMERIEKLFFPILRILRQEKGESLEYIVNGKIKIVDAVSSKTLLLIERGEFFKAASNVFKNITTLSGRSININKFADGRELEEFLEKSRICSLKAKSEDKADIVIQIHDQLTGSDPVLGFSIKSMLGQRSTLFNPGAGTNFVFEAEGIELDDVSIKRINNETYKGKNKIGRRFDYVEQLGGVFKFSKVQSEVLELNLRLIDGDLPEIIAHMLKCRFQSGKSRVDELIGELERANPLKYNQSLNHPFYRYKIIKFLYDAALGMTPEAVWSGKIQANGGIIVVKNDGDVLAYHTYHKSKFEEYLLKNTFLEQPSTGEDEKEPGTEISKEKYPHKKTIKQFKYGWLFLDNEKLKIKVNLQVRFTK